MPISLDPAHISASADAIEARAADLAARRDSLEASVESLTRSWRGEAANRFEAHWSQWRSSVDAVIDELSTSAGALRTARDFVVLADGTATDSAVSLRGRLG